MERFRDNKENKSRNACISNIFKVKKCLFDQTLQNKNTESSSSRSGQQFQQITSPVIQCKTVEDSPYSLFKIKKKRSVLRSKVNCLDYSPCNSIITTPTNKNNLEKETRDEQEEICNSTQSSSHVKTAVQKSVLNPNLIGDFTKLCTLPTIRGKHPDLMSISSDTVSMLLQGTEISCYFLIDCRYPYEFDAGHIKTANNIYMKEDIERILFKSCKRLERNEVMQVLIFYCEFSSERGPRMLRHLRNIDRDMNRDSYPFLYYPELYILEGGYKAFYSSHKQLCDPQQYKTMLDEDCTEELSYYKSRCKSLSRRSKCLKRTSSSLVF